MQEKTPCFKDYMEVVLRQKKWIILGTFIPALVAGLITIFLPDIYRAQTTIYIDRPKAKTTFAPTSVAIFQQENQPFTQVHTQLETYGISAKTVEAMLTNEETFKNIIDSLNLENMTVRRLAKMLKAEGVLEFKTYVSVQYAPLANLIVTIKKDKYLADDIANKWAQIFIEKFNMVFSAQRQWIYQYISEQLEISKLNLEKAQTALLRLESMSDDKKDPIKRQVEHMSFKENVESAKRSYELFRMKLDEAKIAIEERRPMATICARAIEPEEKIGPDRILISLCAAILGFIFSIFFSFFHHYFKSGP